jgi:hypothetical protein
MGELFAVAILSSSTGGDGGNDQSISRGIQASARLAFCSAIFFSLETFPDFPIFFGNRKEVLEALMTMGELFAVAILSSVIFALAAHWQNDSDGGLT